MSITIFDAINDFDLDALRAFLESGVDPVQRNARGLSPIHVAALSGGARCVRLLLDCNVYVDCMSSNKRTPLHFAAASGGLECIRLLIERGANANARCDLLMSPLHYAISGGSADALYVLLSCGANRNAEDLSGITPLDEAIARRSIPCAEVLLDWRAKTCITETFPVWFRRLEIKRRLCNAATRATYALYKYRLGFPRDLARLLARAVWDSRYHGRWMNLKSKSK